MTDVALTILALAGVLAILWDDAVAAFLRYGRR